MPARAQLEFDRRLNTLFVARTHWLRMQVRKPKQGKAPSFNKKKVESAILKLKMLADECLRRKQRVWMAESYQLKKQWQVRTSKGWGIQEKRESFITWFESNIPHPNCVYVFWAKRRCRYVGRTLKGTNRPQSHFQKYWFTGVTRIDIYVSSGRRDVPKLECLATHRFGPSHSRIRPAKKKWHSRCPVCVVHRAVRDEVKSIFRLK